MRQHQQLLRGRKSYATTEQAKRIATGGRDGTKLKAATLATRRSCSPHSTLAPPHARHIASAMTWQRRGVSDLYPQLGHHTQIIEHQPFVKHLANLHASAGGCTAKDQLAETVTRP